MIALVCLFGAVILVMCAGIAFTERRLVWGAAFTALAVAALEGYLFPVLGAHVGVGLLDGAAFVVVYVLYFVDLTRQH